MNACCKEAHILSTAHRILVINKLNGVSAGCPPFGASVFSSLYISFLRDVMLRNLKFPLGYNSDLT